jgi:hypothetical protein
MIAPSYQAFTLYIHLHKAINIYTMRFSILALPLLAAPSLALLGVDSAVSWANALVSSSGGEAQASKGGEVHAYDSWSYTDCGELNGLDSLSDGDADSGRSGY